MNVLVTGAAGFVGSHLAEALAARGDTVVGLDNFNDYYDPARKRRNADAVEAAGATVLEVDIRDRERIFELFEEHRFDAVAHLAALAGVHSAVEHPTLYVEVDFLATQHLMDAARAFGVQNFVFASTSSVHGENPKTPFQESDPCVFPPQPYAAAKRAAELLGFTYHKHYGLNFTSVRFFTVYGPRGRPDMMPGLLAKSLFYGELIPLHEGNIRRDWTFVGDTVAGVVAALKTPLGFEIINLAKGESESLRDFISAMEDAAGKQANLISQPRPPAYMLETYADISKARKLLGFAPTVPIQEGAQRFWQWYEAEQQVLAGV